MPAKAENVVPQSYELLDFGEGRKLERFGEFVVDRPSPAAEGFALQHEARWGQADYRFRKTRGETGDWKRRRSDLPAEWTLEWHRIVFNIRPNASGNVGLFPEAATVWSHLVDLLPAGDRPPRLLNLFAYTGGATLAAACAGAEVVHVDSSAASVAVARENAAASGLAEAPIRWIVEDARKFVERERRRGQTYDFVLLDPPTWGHGPKGQAWRFEDDLPDLLTGVAALIEPVAGTILLTGHAPGWDADRAHRFLRKMIRCRDANARSLSIGCSDGRRLPAGWLAVARTGNEILGAAPRRAADRDDA